ncbi:MAG: phosphate ABC transporter substrate-binding protein PstS [Alphaproteobacteria bacterium]|nr:phosphate ABC transporter substrate-binding protein PstS [Alphaproteobacteria bacterium]
MEEFRMAGFGKILLGALVGASLTAGVAGAAEISGAGATFPYPIYAKWAEAYKAKSGIAMNYQSIGSGGGIKQIESKTVDFGASDMPLKPEELEKAGLLQFPMIMGGEVAVLNVKGIEPGKLKLDGKTLADIYLGKITKWNDAALTKLNPDLKLPDQAIAVVHRSDGSGTTFIFTDYLSKVSPEWSDKVGESTAVEWPVGLGGKGNEGVAALVSRTDGAIGYVEYAYAKQNKLAYALLSNKEGVFNQPNAGSFQAAAANADWQKAPGYYLLLTDQPGKESWPITGASFILMYKKQDKPETAKQVLQFFDWSYRNGQKMADELDYVPMPENVVKLVEDAWKKEMSDPGSNPVWTGPAS